VFLTVLLNENRARIHLQTNKKGKTGSSSKYMNPLLFIISCKFVV